MITLPPFPRSTILFTTTCESVKMPFKLVLSTLSQSSSVIFKIGFSVPPMPELFTSMSIWPISLITSLTRISISSLLSISHRWGRVLTPVFSWISLQASSHFLTRRAAMTMWAPASARPSAIPRPMPVAPPEIMATLSVKSNSCNPILESFPILYSGVTRILQWFSGLLINSTIPFFTRSFSCIFALTMASTSTRLSSIRPIAEGNSLQ